MDKLGIYIHIPFCDQICHYCDFAKTANYTQKYALDYLSRIKKDISELKTIEPLKSFSGTLSLYLGGGTPSVFTTEYEGIFDELSPYLNENSEITIEANPEHISEDKLLAWRALGFNRLSLGVQSFNDEGLKFLTRTHNESSARAAIKLAMKHFDNVNADLIYGWSGQDTKTWKRDLEIMCEVKPHHVSLYSLTYEPATVIGRRKERGLIVPDTDERLAGYYDLAKEKLKREGYFHEEISNWHLEGKDAFHNNLYWTGENYIGIGLGAHGYLPSQGNFGIRYSFAKNWKQFLESTSSDFSDMESWLRSRQADTEKDRDWEDWLLEYVGCGLRSRSGIDLDLIAKKTGLEFIPRNSLLEGLKLSLLKKRDNNLTLIEDEWFRETAWSVEVVMSWKEHKGKRL